MIELTQTHRSIFALGKFINLIDLFTTEHINYDHIKQCL